MPIVSLEGSDLTGKTSTLSELSERLENGFEVNRGPIYSNQLISRCLDLSKEADEKGREFLYTAAYVADAQEHERQENEQLVLQDRYWPSVITYGRFLNGEDSLYHDEGYSEEAFIEPDLVFHLTCSVEERLRRDRERDENERSPIDEKVLSSEEEMRRMDYEVERAVEDLNTYRIDTTDMSISAVASEVEEVLYEQGILEQVEV